ncbi:hypothetical protein RIF29_40709 [Crotalaria pallida]|uniref:Uncharacterized protein n=1 Tax=Crotalaria pallida TaxID=3830 RepID=A0AAN9E9X5_CROPI
MSDSNNHATDDDASIGSNKGRQHVKEKRPPTEDPKPEISEDEADIIARMHRLLGNRWSLIAGRIPGRTAEEIEKYWTSKFGSLPSDQCSSTDD